MDVRGARIRGDGGGVATPLAGVVIPAHNEARSIGATLAALQEGLAPGALDIVVVCNGCTDATAEVARRAAPSARVVEIVQAGKADAVSVGDLVSTVFPRVHLDADVLLPGTDLVALVRPLVEDGLLASAPRRVLPREGVSHPVRWYYDVWEQLPQVRGGLFGRGVIAVSEAGQARIDRLPRLMSDDLAVSDAFGPEERCVVLDAAATVRPPRRLRDLLRRRIRVATGVAQADRYGARRTDSVTTPGVLGRLVLARPGLALRLPVFLGVTVAARLQSRGAVRSGDFTTWLRDDSSRA